MLKITLKKGIASRSAAQKATVLSLGLHKIGQSVTRPDNPAVRGMIHAVDHLVSVEEVK